MKVRKIRFYPNKTQRDVIDRTLKGCHYVWNMCTELQYRSYITDKRYIHWNELSKMINYHKHEEETWLKNTSSKAIKDVVRNHNKAYQRFFNGISRKPKFKSWKRNPTKSFYIIWENIHYLDKKTHIKIPILGKIRIRERGELIPHYWITSGRVLKEYGRYYVCLYYEEGLHVKFVKDSPGIGIDLGITKYATIYSEDGLSRQIESFLNDKRYKMYHEKIILLNRLISNKVKINYKRILEDYIQKHGKEPSGKYKNIMKGVSYNTSNIKKLRKKLENIRFKLKNYVDDWIKQRVNTIVTRIKPRYITLETLSISDMLQNDSSSTLHDHIAKSNFYKFTHHLANKATEFGIEVRYANRYFASSKTCSNCGHKKKSLQLSDREYICKECGLEIDRDLNAAINLCFLEKYKVFK